MSSAKSVVLHVARAFDSHPTKTERWFMEKRDLRLVAVRLIDADLWSKSNSRKASTYERAQQGQSQREREREMQGHTYGLHFGSQEEKPWYFPAHI